MIGLLTKNVIRVKLAPMRQRKKRLAALFALLLIVMFPASIYFSVRGMFFNLAYGSGLGEKAVYTFLSFSFAGLFLLLLFTGLGSALHHFFLADDLQLLLSLPIAPQLVFFIKYFECVLNGFATFIFFGAPVLIAFIDFSSGGALTAVIGAVASVFFVSAAVAFIQLIAAVTGAMFNAARMRKYAFTAAGLFTIALWAGLQWLRLDRFDPQAPGFDAYAAHKVIAALSNVSFSVFPSQQLVDALFSVLHGNLITALLHLGILGTFAAVAIGGSIALRIRQEPLLQFDVPAKKNKMKKFQRSEAAEEGIPDWRRVLLMKEFKITLRDIRMRHVLLLFTVAMILWPMMQNAGTDEAAATKWATAFFAAASANIITRQSIPQERGAFVYTRLAPLKMKSFLIAKAVPAMILLGAAIIPGQIINMLRNHIDRLEMLHSFLLPFGCVAIGSAVGLYSGARFGRFDWRDPRQMISIGAGYLSMVISLAAAGLGLGLCLTAEFIGYNLAFGLFFLYVYVIFAVSLALSQKHLSTMDWILTS